jgi:hypothetical protein
MSDHPRLPDDLLPGEHFYKPQRRGSFAPSGKVVGWITFLVITLFVLGLFRVSITSEHWYALAALLFVGFLIKVIIRNRNMHRIVQENQNAVALLESSQLDEGARRLDEMCRKPTLPQFHAFLVFNRGVGFLKQGNPERALSLFAAVLNCGWLEIQNNSFFVYYPLLLNGIATSYAIKGDIPTAEHWQGIAHDHITPERMGTLLCMDTLIGIRNQRYEIVVSDAEKGWENAESNLPAGQMKNLRILCAFALSHVNHNNVHDEKIRQFLDGARPFRMGQFDYLTVNWPELKAFLQFHGFSMPVMVSPVSVIKK